MLPLLSQPSIVGVEVEEKGLNFGDSANELPALRASPAPTSLIAQAVSIFDKEEVDGANDDKYLHSDFDMELKKLYSGHELENMILDETIDDKQDMLMEGP